ncbi:MAG: S-layer homology domain-containing protein [Candidatus Aminicenantes bacterium]
MVKKASALLSLFFLIWSCATYQPPPPSLYIGNLPPSVVTELSLDERIITEEAWNNLKQGRGKKAEKIISKLSEESPFYYVGLGYASFLLHQLSEAEMFFKRALELYPEMNLIHIGLAQVYQKTGREDLAFVELRDALKKEPDNPWAKQEYQILQERKTEEALQEASRYLALENEEKSKEAYLKALYYSPQSTAAHLGLADIYRKENNLQSALMHLKSAVSNEPHNREALKIYAETLSRAEDYPRSLEVYEKLRELEPENEEFRNQIEVLKNRLGIFELPSQYDAIPASEAITKEETAALLAVKFKDFLEEPSARPPIIIDISTSWASRYILQTASLGILDVYKNHTFQPKKVVTRAEMADILWQLINYLKSQGFTFIRQLPPDKIQISDVSPQNIYYQPILQMVSYDIMSLSSKRAFNPELPVSGQEAIRLSDIILTLIK